MHELSLRDTLFVWFFSLATALSSLRLRLDLVRVISAITVVFTSALKSGGH